VKLTPQLSQALTNLRGNADFKVFLEGLKEYEADRKQACVENDGLPLYRAQGAVKTLQFLQQWFVDAPSTLEKFKNQQGKNTQ